jgi:Fe-S cluster assembly iron-binding protein IscA
MVQIKYSAIAHLVRVRRERGLDDEQAARFVAHGGRVLLTFAREIQPGDQELNGAQIRVLVAPDVARRLEGATLFAAPVRGREVVLIQRMERSAQS